MIPLDILVATAADFALLRNGRPVASGLWDDVMAAQAAREGSSGTHTLRLVLRLRDGAEFTAADDAPGWDDFVEAAERALPGMVPVSDWWRGVPPDDARATVPVFTRGSW